ncbi:MULTISPECIES: bile acid:sodium symporter family protein [Streptomycetaceae]|uniref:Transmembrane protein n=1 Tax=Streptantibioticus cattleyicolor (strain ATCC 35852 / DSM 46488 / JCM 4925 / NBRC 14057 / NRRL 8057) TaxID=1003195 RepID=F8JZH9_STREN|nr:MULTISPECIES: bile acid:sodium symporter family protein [Streptomycetaceae]AEW97280.1 transmembrane protein [Streptantibioticus cattleyicolor NRRL 8057 = DSM 46488]MYS61733.1 bile acid:sodium symporter [Streptomyces sp. SID5468]CCB77601.1 putative sodium/bile acid symporter family (mazG-like) [Streptantibioticus cattleyicolor NRRL 8057 = DSM 46488]
MARIAMPTWLPIDPYIAVLVATVGLAALLPAEGGAATAVGGASTVAVGLLFFLYGARLSTREAVAGLSHWRLHLTVVASTFALFPLLGLAARGLVPHVLTPQLYTGLLYLCVLPSTIQSSIAFTSIARGNVSAAICAGTYSSLLGMVLTPLLAGVLLDSGGAGFSAHGLADIGLQLFAPFLAGQLLRRWIGPFITRHKKVLGLVDRGSILLVVYTAFSEGMVQGIWHQVTVARLLVLVGVEAVLLALVLTVTSATSRRLRFGRADRTAIVFCGSKKSLANGLPMASVLFGAHAGLIVLPLMLFHQMQLMVCAVIAKRWSTAGDDGGEGSLPSERSSNPDAQARPVTA